MDINTHRKIDPALCGSPEMVAPGKSRVKLLTPGNMAADERGLVHGGFVFGLADYAAMLAVNDPNVVLGAATVKFFKPVVVGEALVAEAGVAEAQGKKNEVRVVVKRREEVVFEGRFTCFVLERHVLADRFAAADRQGEK